MEVFPQIEQLYGSLRGARKRIASLVLQDPADCCFYSLKQFAKAAGCSEVTMLSFCKQLGYPSFIAFRHALQSTMREGTRATRRVDVLLSRPGTLSETFLKLAQAEAGSIAEALRENHEEALMRVVCKIRNAKRRYVVAHGASKIAACYLAERLTAVGADATLLDFDMPQMAIGCLTRGEKDSTLLMAVATPPYGKSTVAAVRLARQLGIPVVSFTDSRQSPLAQDAEAVFCPTSQEFGGMTNSYAPFMVMIELVSFLYRFGRQEQREDEAGPLVEQYLMLKNE